ncbi:hypothetical protein SERLA73DRAFT_51815 [Serpula lacrymans var. lacrymans S7.3]|uniref:Altered inheritance of mitochondria protein 41 n=1 Tax=Serpula lacrymans var. lacrymans (strain S7.3) TaxID=936435 RepID=F8PVG8_SERL3|nr:hypothetical protein SERLA73DRAFT_51815 [Serpula lacrymans var. lacrymans S7.3]
MRLNLVYLQSILSEVYAADKISPPKAPSSSIISILRKAALRRKDSAAQFIQASRPDLADKEENEAAIISAFLPPVLSEDAIDSILTEVLAELPPSQTDSRKNLGRVYKSFYSKVDKSMVDTDAVKRRAEVLMTFDSS